MTNNTCKNCSFYEPGFDGKPGVCTFSLVADIWNGYDLLKSDWVGYSDNNWDSELSLLYVGEDFGCIHFKEGK